MMVPSDEELLEYARRQLADAGVWDVEGDIEALAERFLGRSPGATRVAEFEAAVAERRARIPLGHITGCVDFDGMRLLVGGGVFVPRRESVALVDWAADEAVLPAGGRVLDLCAGVGTLGLAIARRRPDACVWCLERDDTAVQYLRRNLARQAAVTGQLTVQVADLMEPDCLDAHAGATDVIVANPPYVPPSQPLPPEWAEHHPRAAVYGGADGFDVIRRIAALGAITLRPDGQLALEHDRSQPEAVQQILIHHGYSDVTTVTDSAGDRRITVARIAAKEQSG